MEPYSNKSLASDFHVVISLARPGYHFFRMIEDLSHGQEHPSCL